MTTVAGNSPLLTPPPEQRERRNSACSGHRPLYRVPGGISEESPTAAAATGEAPVLASSDSNGEGGEEAKGATAAATGVGRKLSKVGLRKLKIW